MRGKTYSLLGKFYSFLCQRNVFTNHKVTCNLSWTDPLTYGSWGRDILWIPISYNYFTIYWKLHPMFHKIYVVCTIEPKLINNSKLQTLPLEWRIRWYISKFFHEMYKYHRCNKIVEKSVSVLHSLLVFSFLVYRQSPTNAVSTYVKFHLHIFWTCKWDNSR